MSKQSVNLGQLQVDAENAAKTLKGARTSFTNAKQAVDKAEEAHAVAQKSLALGLEAVKTATKVG